MTADERFLLEQQVATLEEITHALSTLADILVHYAEPWFDTPVREMFAGNIQEAHENMLEQASARQERLHPRSKPNESVGGLGH